MAAPIVFPKSVKLIRRALSPGGTHFTKAVKAEAMLTP